MDFFTDERLKLDAIAIDNAVRCAAKAGMVALKDHPQDLAVLSPQAIDKLFFFSGNHGMRIDLLRPKKRKNRNKQ